MPAQHPFAIVSGYQPGAIGRIAGLHAQYYHRLAGFGLIFEAKVAEGVCEFLRRYDPARDGLWLVCKDGSIEGSIAIDGLRAGTEGARLRWFIVSDALRGSGAGNALMTTAMDFCHQRGYRRVRLDTFAGLDAARHLYEKFGFRLVHQVRGARWGVEVDEQVFERNA